MYQITSSLLFYFIKTASGKESTSILTPENNVKMMFKDLFTSYMVKMNAAVKLQSWFRGIQGRKKLLSSEKHKPFVSKMIAKRATLKDSSATPQRQGYKEPPLFSVFGDFLKVISTFSNQSAEMLKQTEGLIQAFKMEITERFKAKIMEDLEQYKEEQKQYSDHLLATIKSVVLKPKSERACQTETIQFKSRGVQHGVSQVTNVELRK